MSDAKLDAAIEESQGILVADDRIEFIKNLQRDWPEYLYRTYTVNQNTHQSWSSAVTGHFVPKGWDFQGLEGVSFA